MDMQIMNAPFPTLKHILWFTSSGWHPLLKMENSHGSDVSVSVQRYVSFTDAKGWGPVDRWVEGNSNDCVFCKGGGRRVQRCEVKGSRDGRAHTALRGNERVWPLPRFITRQGGKGSQTHETDRDKPRPLCMLWWSAWRTRTLCFEPPMWQKWFNYVFIVQDK